MAKRKINVEKLSEEQLIKAEKIITDTIDSYVQHLNKKWNTELAPYGKACSVQISIDTEDKIKNDMIEHESYVKSLAKGDVCPESDLGLVASDLRCLADSMEQDINSAVTACNKLLNRYGMACMIGISEQSISKQYDRM